MPSNKESKVYCSFEEGLEREARLICKAERTLN
jgi:hypothetical protein